MRYKDPNDQTATFTPLEPHQMVRAALVEGMKPRYDEREKYRNLAEYYLGIDGTRIDNLFSLMEEKNPTKKQKAFLDDLICELAYDNKKNWNNLNYKNLKNEGVIVEYSGDFSGLVQKVLDTEENKVIFAQNPDFGEKDYVKHIDWRNKLFLNGADVIIRFAEDKGFKLPKNFLKYRKPTKEVYSLLEQHGFTYTRALKTAIKVLKEPKYAKRNISALVIKNRNGNELRQHQLDFIEAAEMLRYMLWHGKPIKQKVGDQILELCGKDYAANEFLVPKRITRGGWDHDTVEIHYLPDFVNQGKNILEWMNTVTECNCEHAFNLRNLEERRGWTTRIAQTFDPHIGAAVLALQFYKKISPNKNPNNLNPLPTRAHVEFADKLRYNVAIETQVGRIRKRARLNEAHIEILINELAKEWEFEDMYGPKERIKDFITRPMY